MKFFSFIIAIALSFVACNRLVTSNAQDEASKPLGALFTLADAEKILGEKAHETDSSLTITKEETTYLGSFTADAKEEISDKTGVVYFFAEEYAEVAGAQKKYSSIKNANEKSGIKALKGLGDEAYYHSDGQNFYFVMVRKGNRVFNMKVNKITSHTSSSEFNQVARKITDEL
jgi:hypothetical protein